MKKMKLAHIVPENMLQVTASNQYHMSLAHLIYANKRYRLFYKTMSALGRYVLMDNGAAEDSQLSVDQLFECWKWCHPTEMVLPDTLLNSDETFTKSAEALKYFKSKGVTANFMAVPQGKTLDEWVYCAEKLMTLNPTCIGVSKFLTIATSDVDVRYKAVKELSNLVKKTGQEIEVHLLGCDAGPSEVKQIHDDFEFVRGCDTALAYIYTKAGVPLTARSLRPVAEMDFLKGNDEFRCLLCENIGRFNEVVGVNNMFGDITWK